MGLFNTVTGNYLEVNGQRINIDVNDITLRVEGRISKGEEIYVFNGFMNETTFAFERIYTYRTLQAYHQAKVGYEFKLIGFEHLKFKVKEVNRDKGTIQLEVKANY